MNSLEEKTNQRVYFNNALGKGLHGMIGPVCSKGTRYIFAQGRKGSRFYEVGEADLNGQLISDMGEDCNRSARQILGMVGQ